LSAENYGIISAGATELKGTVESGHTHRKV
jgi:hypothetical protein